MSFRSVLKLFLILVTLAGGPISAYAETMWLSDMLWVNIRTGPSDSNRILKVVKSGTRMEILEKPDGSDYYRVRTDAGLEGWIPHRYLSAEPTGAIQAKNMEAEKQQLQTQFDQLQTKYTNLLADKGDVNGELETLRSSNAELSSELNRIKTISGDAIDLDSQYQTLAEENARIKNELDVLKAENKSLKEFNDNKILYTGGALILLGIFLGFILPRLTGKRRKEGWS